jgi:predicted GNAT superfamily acetyltransferase
MELNKKGDELRVRLLSEADLENALALNEELVHFLSHLEMENLQHLWDESAVSLVVEEKGAFAGFLLAFREGADYDSINYKWFESNYPKFLYVDRVVITPNTQSGGLGTAFYNEVFRIARETGVPVVTAEYYVVPPNVVSEKFHTRFGFKEVGRQQTADGKKTVSLQVAKVTD